MKRILSFISLTLLCILTLSCAKESPTAAKPDKWIVFTVGSGVPFRAYFDKSHYFEFVISQSSRGVTQAGDYPRDNGICLVNNTAELGKIQDFDALSYQEQLVLYEGACVVERSKYNGYTAYTAFTIEDWETSSMLGHYQLIQVKYPDGKIYPEPIEE